MLQQTALKPYPREALLVRELVDEVVRTRVPIDTVIKRPTELTSVTLCMMVRDEWQTLEEVIESCLPLPTELVIGVDVETDSELSFAYREAFLTKGEKAREFFDSFMNLDPPRRATIPEVAQFMGVPEKFIQKRIEAYLKDGKPTYRIAKKMIERVGKGRIVEVDFNNHFSNARNQILPHCTGDLCFFVDGHEYLSDVQALMKTLVIAQNEHPKFLRFGVLIDMEDSPVRERNRQTRIWRNLPGVKFTRGVHNQLSFDGIEDDGIDPTTDECSLIHRRPGWLAVFRETQRRKMILDHMGGEADTSSLYYSGLSHQRSSNFEKAIECFNEYLRLSPPGPESAMVCWYMGRCYEFGLEDKAAAEKSYYAGIKKCPDAAFCHTAIAMMRLKEEEQEESEAVKTRMLLEALAHCRFAEASVHPGGTIAIPTLSYTWDPQLKKAEALRRLKRFGESAQAIERALSFDMDYAFKTQSEIALMEMREENFKQVDGELRLSKKTGQTHIYIVDENQSTGRDVYQIASGMGHHVVASKEFDIPTFYRSDIIWVEHAGQNALQASRIMYGDRRVIVRVYPEDLMNGVFNLISWERFAKVVVVSDQLQPFIPVQSDAIGHIQGFIEGAPPIEADDIVTYIPYAQEHLLQRIFELAMLTSRTIHIFGYIRDVVAYEGFVAKCVKNRLEHVNLHWQVHPDEISVMLAHGGIYVSLSDAYDENMDYALGMGRKAITTNPNTNHPECYCPSLAGVAERLLFSANIDGVAKQRDEEELVGRVIDALIG